MPTADATGAPIRRSVLVIGGTGILAPAARALAEAGATTTAGARGRRAAPTGVELLVMDGRVGFDADGRRWDQAIVYLPAVTAQTLTLVREAVSSRLVEVRPSAAADPARGDFALEADVLQLGWAEEGGERRWHSPDEVSAAALQVLADGDGRVLGLVRPWGDRP